MWVMGLGLWVPNTWAARSTATTTATDPARVHTFLAAVPQAPKSGKMLIVTEHLRFSGAPAAVRRLAVLQSPRRMHHRIVWRRVLDLKMTQEEHKKEEDTIWVDLWLQPWVSLAHAYFPLAHGCSWQVCTVKQSSYKKKWC